MVQDKRTTYLFILLTYILGSLNSVNEHRGEHTLLLRTVSKFFSFKDS